MYGETSRPESPVPSSRERLSLADILARDAAEPSMAEAVLKAANVLDLQLKDAQARAIDAEAQNAVLEEELALDRHTGLWTEDKFDEEVVAWSERKDASLETPIAIIFIDMNNLKHINDTLGHKAGDDAIRALAEKLRFMAESGLRSDDFRAISRSNKAGDEFILALPAREQDDVRQEDEAGAGEPYETLREKINKLIAKGSEDDYYACGCIVTTRGDIQEYGLDYYKEIADERMYKNKQRMKQRLSPEDFSPDEFTGAHHI